MINLAGLMRGTYSWLRPQGPVTFTKGVLLYAPNVVRAGTIIFCVVGVLFSIPYSIEHWNDPRLVAIRLFVVGLACLATTLVFFWIEKYYRTCVLVCTLIGTTATLVATTYMDGPNVNPHSMLVLIYVLGAGLCLGQRGALITLIWLVANLVALYATAGLDIWPHPTSISVARVQSENLSALFFMLLSLTPVLLGYLAVVERSIMELRQSYADQARLLQRLMAARESERKHLTHVLHEGAVQYLGALHLALDRNAPQEELVSLLDTALGKLRNLSSELHPPMLDHYGLEAALEQLVVSRGGTVEPHLRIDRLERLAPAIEIALFRIAQEALNNIHRHSNARHIWMRFGCAASNVVLEIRDDGIGFDVDTILRRTIETDHFGLATMHELALSVGATLQITSKPQMGTTVTATLPYRPRSPQGDLPDVTGVDVIPQPGESRSVL